jgi:hypothetical protein
MPAVYFFLITPPLGANLLALWVGFRNRKALDQPLRLLLYYVSLCLVTTLSMVLLAILQGNNRVIAHLFAPLQLLVFAWIYASWAPKLLGKAFKIAAVAYGLSCLILLPLEDLRRLDGPSFHIQTMLMMGCSLSLLCHLALQVDRPLLDHPGAWIASGILCDMAITLVAYSSRDWLLIHARSWAFWLNLFRMLVVTGSYLFFLRALTLRPISSDK